MILYSPVNYPELTEAIIPEVVYFNNTEYRVSAIGEDAFEYCSSLTKNRDP